MYTKQKGFTLIELMIVMAIIALLAVIALPSYQRFILKTQVTRVVGEVAYLKSNVENCINERRVLIGEITQANFNTTCDPGATVSTLLRSDDVNQVGRVNTVDGGFAQIVILSDGAASMAVRFGTNAHASLAGLGIVWIRGNNGNWSCTVGVVTPGVTATTLASVTASVNRVKQIVQICPDAE